MVRRLLQTTRGNSFFLFGARRTGKTTYIRDASNPDTSLYIDLLDPEIEDTYRRTPHRLEQQIRALPDTVEWVLIDEVQRAPRLRGRRRACRALHVRRDRAAQILRERAAEQPCQGRIDDAGRAAFIGPREFVMRDVPGVRTGRGPS